MANLKSSFTALAMILAAPFAARSQDADTCKTWTLQDCIDYALKENISLKKSRIEVENAAIDIWQSKAEMYPGLSFSTNQNIVNRPYQQTSSTVSGSEIIESNGPVSYNGNYGLNAQWTLYSGGRLRNTVRQNELSGRIAELNVETSENSIQESITQLYIQILYADEAVKVNENILQTSIAECERGAYLYEAGSISKADYAQLQSQVSSDRYQLVSSEAALQDYKLQLKQMLELEGDMEMEIYIPEISDEDILKLLPQKGQVYQTALETRPEMLSGNLNIESSELGIDISSAGYYPTISLSAGIGTNHTSGSGYSFAEQLKKGWNNSAGVTISIPIFSNLQNKSSVSKAKLQYQTAKLDLAEQQKELYKSIENFWLDASSAQQQYIAAKEKANSAMASYELVSEQFNLGMKNTVELLTEKNNLSNARLEMIQAKYMALLNIRLLDFYQGKNIEL